jgi:hypothetical protein
MLSGINVLILLKIKTKNEINEIKYKIENKNEKIFNQFVKSGLIKFRKIENKIIK